ncbi:MAG: hypothetical protein AB8C46_01005 [Burkholderiaceae bacterium]
MATDKKTREKSALSKARAAKKKAQAALVDQQPTGIGLSRRADHYVIKVLLSSPLSDDSPCPSVIDGVPIEFEVVGSITKSSAVVSTKAVKNMTKTSSDTDD